MSLQKYLDERQAFASKELKVLTHSYPFNHLSPHSICCKNWGTTNPPAIAQLHVARRKLANYLTKNCVANVWGHLTNTSFPSQRHGNKLHLQSDDASSGSESMRMSKIKENAMSPAQIEKYKKKHTDN